MRAKTIDILTCPNSRSSGWNVYAIKAERNQKELFNISNESLQAEDNIMEGILINQDSQTAYPVYQSVAVLLSDTDADVAHLQTLFGELSPACPEEIKKIIQSTFSRIVNTVQDKEGSWNKGEMRYYDEAVNTPGKRRAMLQDIRQYPLWRIFLPRQKDITSFLEKEIQNKTILEIGCGNARTISWILHPAGFNYNYIGTDISFNRLLAASQNIPEGDFIQCSAFNLPFRKEVMDAVLSFGVLHHLPNPAESLRQCSELLKTGGYIGFHEPIEKPKIFSGMLSLFAKWTTDYQHSEHDGEINWHEMKPVLSQLKLNIIHFRFYNSVFRSLAEWIFNKFSRKLLRKKIIMKAVFAADSVILQTVCKISGRLGPHAVTALIRKQP